MPERRIKQDIPLDPAMAALYDADNALDDIGDALVETIVVHFETDEFGEVEAVATESELQL